jgi:hypothetical protein
LGKLAVAFVVVGIAGASAATYTTEVVSSVPWPYSLYVSETTFAQTTITVNPK